MPLTPSTNAQVISDMGTFSFPMIEGETVVPVQVTDDTLEYMASRDHTHLDEPVCTENLIRVDDVMESLKLAE